MRNKNQTADSSLISPSLAGSDQPNRPNHEEDRLMTVVEAAEFLQLDVGTIYHFVSAKKIPVIKISARCIRFSRAGLLQWIESLTQSPETIPGSVHSMDIRRKRAKELL
jgi:excisionase family DNA binding protein